MSLERCWQRLLAEKLTCSCCRVAVAAAGLCIKRASFQAVAAATNAAKAEVRTVFTVTASCIIHCSRARLHFLIDLDRLLRDTFLFLKPLRHTFLRREPESQPFASME